MAFKNFTIKLADTEDIDKFNDLKAEKKQTQAGTLNFLLNQQKGEVNQDANLVIIENLKKEIENLTVVNQGLLTEKEGLLNDITALNLDLENVTKINKDMILEFEELNSKEPEVKEIELTGNQFICEPTEEVAKMARILRPFITKEGKFKGTSDDYPNWLFNSCVKRWLTNNYDHILDA